MAYLSYAGQAFGALSSIRAGRDAKAQAKQNARQTVAVAQRDSQQARREALLLRSRALAVAAASGGGVEDPTVSKLLADIDAQGEVNALNALYAGEDDSRVMRAKGSAMSNEGYARGVSSILSMGGDLYEKYG